MSRRFLHISLCLLTAASGLALSSCLKEEMAVDNISRPSDYVCFSSALNSLSGSVATRGSADYLEIEEEDWPLEGKVTKAAPMTGLTDGLAVGIIGFNYTGSWSDSNTPWSSGGASLDNISYTYSSSTGAVTAASPIPWKDLTYKTASDKLRIYAYAPMGDFSSYIVKDGSGNIVGVPQISYTVPDAVGDQKDLIVANNEVAANAKTTIPLNFTHALTAIQFKVGFACYMTSLQIKGVYGTGTYTIGSGWSANTPKDFTAISYDTQSFAADAMIADGAKTFLMIPQTVPAGATVVLKFKATPEGVEKTLTAKIDGQTWLAGKRITYTIKETPTGYIYFDLAAGNVTITQSTYTGYVYTNNSRTDGNKVTVSGDHNSANKYYVYQSSSSKYGGWSGAQGSSVFSLPNYNEVTIGGKTWSEYVTNNSDSEEVINNWHATSPNGSMNLDGRSYTSNFVKIYHTTSPSTLIADVTIDNLWSNVYRYVDSGDNDSGVIAGMNGNSSGLATIDVNKHTGITLRIKGDNRFKAVHFSTPVEGDYFTVTSYDGDGSTKGSMSVMPTNSTDVSTKDGGLCAARLSNTYEYFKVKEHYGFSIKGGTIYVASPTTTGNTKYCFYSCIGGARNTNINMSISGGNITSVAHGTSAAIGAGGGHDGRGGDANISISGGKIYAYNFGTAYHADGNTFPVAATAIGGGSTYKSEANSGTVTISGGEVYAQSTGGVAIGGGSSGGGNGGVGIVSISGTAKVTAKSVTDWIEESLVEGMGLAPSILAHYYVQAGTSIGGGTGGDVSQQHTDPIYKPENQDGGAAEIEITGGTLLAGSIGGGKAGSCIVGGVEQAKMGTATVNVSGSSLVQGQFIMTKGTAVVAPSFTMTGGTIQNDLADIEFTQIDGGAVYIDEGTCTISGGTIRNSGSTRKGGAVYMNRGSFTMSSSAIIENCSARSGGGAVYIDDGNFTMYGGTIRSCVSSTSGGAIFVDGGNVEVNAGTITSNIADGASANGGGVYITRGSFSMPGGSTATISGNHARNDGGGVYITSTDEDVTVEVLSGSITGNTSDYRGGGLCILPGGGHTASIILGIADQGTLNPAISGNESALSGGGLYAEGANANISIYSGNIRGNNVSAYVANNDIANEGGLVTLYGGDVDYRTVTFNANGGEGADQIQKIVTATNTHLQVPAAAQGFSKTDHHLTGWNTAANGSGTAYAINDTRVMNISENITLYAQWAAN